MLYIRLGGTVIRKSSISEKLLLEEIMETAAKTKLALRGLSVGALIKKIRLQLGMSQQALAKRAHVPQSTVSRVEQERQDTSISTLSKLLKALSCDLVITPVLKEPIEVLKQKQAKKLAQKKIHYLKGTMNLEDQQPDALFIEALLQEEIHNLLQTPKKLWEE